MPSTPLFGFRYPAGADAADVPTDMNELATDVETLLATKGIRSAGKSVVAAEQTTSSTTFADLGTPDRVSGIVLPADGLLEVDYRALFKLVGALNPGEATIFLNGVQVKRITAANPPAFAAGALENEDNFGAVVTNPAGLLGGVNAGTMSADSTLAGGGTGLVWPQDTSPRGPVIVEADAGTYDVSIRFRVASSGGGTLHVKERKLRVCSKAFG